MTEREKMIEAINSVQAYGIMSNAFGGDLPVTNEMLADALIAANIGDVTEHKEIIRDLNTDVVAYRALCKADDLEQIIEGQKSLIDEYKHRAEVAERQAILLSKWLAEKTRKDYPWQAWFDEAQKQAERELAKEGKDG